MVYLFDWGNTLMRDWEERPGPMCDWDSVELMPYADEVLRVLSERYRCCVATNARKSGKPEIVKALQRGGIDGFLYEIFCFLEIGVPKPEPAYFDFIVRRLGVDRSELLMVGDGLETDVMGPLSQGIRSILYDPNHLFPDYKGEKISDLRQLLA